MLETKHIWKSKPFIAFWSATAAILLLLVTMAAAADFHPHGYDENCNLCHFLTVSVDLVSPGISLPFVSVVLGLELPLPISIPKPQSYGSSLYRGPPLY